MRKSYTDRARVIFLSCIIDIPSDQRAKENMSWFSEMNDDAKVGLLSRAKNVGES